MNKLLIVQISLLTAGIICIFTCFFLTIAEYHEPMTSLYIQITFALTAYLKAQNGVTLQSEKLDCGARDQNQSNQCISWEWNYAMGILVIICCCLSLAIVIAKEFLLRALMSQYTKQVRIGTFAISSLSLFFALTGLIWLVSCQDDYVLELWPMFLMVLAGILNFVGGLVMENLIMKSKGETLLN